MLPLAPGRLSITTLWPSRTLSGCPSVRAMTSVAPPGGLPVTSWMGRLGKVCAAALSGAGSSAEPISASMESASVERRFILMPPRSSPCMLVPIAEKVRRRRRAPDVALLGVPDLGALRAVAVPGSRVEIAEGLVLHVVELDVDPDHPVVVIGVERRDVVAGPEPHRAPDDGDFPF